MADYKVSQMTRIGTVTAADKTLLVDVADTTTQPAGPAGSNKWATIAQVLGVTSLVFPSADPTGATDPARIQAAIGAYGAATLMPGGQYYLGGSSATTLGASQSLNGNWATVTIAASATFAQAFFLNGQGANIERLFFLGASTTTTSNPACDAIDASAATSCRVRDIRGQYVNGWLVKSAAGSGTSVADCMPSRITGRNCAAGVWLEGVTGTSFLGEQFLTDIQLQQMGVTSGPNANLDALYIADCGDITGNNINIGMASGVAGRAVHVSGACATIILSNLDVGANAVSGGVPAIHIDAATGNGTPSGVRLSGSSQGGLYACQVDAGADVNLDLRLHGAYSSNLKINGTPGVVFRGVSAAANQGGGGSAYDVDASGMTGGSFRAKGAVFETAVGSAAAGVVPNVASVNSNCWFESSDFAGSGTTPSTVFTGTPQQVIACPGYNPRGSVTAPTITTGTYTPSGYQTPLMVIFTAINGMTSYSIGGVSVPLPAVGVPYYIGARQSHTVVSSGSVPTWQWFAL